MLIREVEKQNLIPAQKMNKLITLKVLNQIIEQCLIWRMTDKISSKNKKKEMLKDLTKIFKDKAYKKTSKVLNLKVEAYLIWRMIEKKL